MKVTIKYTHRTVVSFPLKVAHLSTLRTSVLFVVVVSCDMI